MTHHKPLSTPLLRLLHLRDVVFPLAERMEREGRLDLDIYAEDDYTEHSCGSAGCLLGWAVSTKQLQKDGWLFDNEGLPWFNEKDGMRAADEYYNIGWSNSRALFHTSFRAGSLKNRRHQLDRIIQEKLAQEIQEEAHA